MSDYYRWCCDDLKEFFDPKELLGPHVNRTQGYSGKHYDVVDSAWVVAALQLGRWARHSVRLVSSPSDAYDCEGYEEVSHHVLRSHLENQDRLLYMNHLQNLTENDWPKLSPAALGGGRWKVTRAAARSTSADRACLKVKFMAEEKAGKRNIVRVNLKALEEQIVRVQTRLAGLLQARDVILEHEIADQSSDPEPFV
jgi:hypothetical protein